MLIKNASSLINQGDLYWIDGTAESEDELGVYSHPYVVVQDNLFNHSRIHSVVVCALTTNTKRFSWPGNVLLDVGEAGLLKHSAVDVAKISAVDKLRLGQYIGTLTKERIAQILAGIRLLQSSFS